MRGQYSTCRGHNFNPFFWDQEAILTQGTSRSFFMHDADVTSIEVQMYEWMYYFEVKVSFYTQHVSPAYVGVRVLFVNYVDGILWKLRKEKQRETKTQKPGHVSDVCGSLVQTWVN